MNTIFSIKMPVGTDMPELRLKLSNVKKSKGKTANALIAAYILKLAK